MARTASSPPPAPPTTLESESGQLFDLAFHPTQPLLATGSIDGLVECWNYRTGEKTVTIRPKQRKGAEGEQEDLAPKACRAVAYHPGGQLLFAASADASLTAYTADGRVALRRPNAHKHPINALHVLDAHLLATGDDEGIIKVWDMRTRRPAFRYHDHADYISALTWVEGRRSLLSAGGDGCLTVYDVRKPKPVGLSSNQEDELLSLTTVKHDSKVVVGTQSGTLLLFSWGQWDDCSDRFPGHPASVDTLLPLDEGTVLTGSSDGMLRAVDILPNRFRGLVGDHGGFPVERLAMAPGLEGQEAGEWVASCSHDGKVRFWSVAEALGGEEGEAASEEEEASSSDSDDDDEDSEDAAPPSKRRRDARAGKTRPGKGNGARPRNTFFDGLASDDGEEGGSRW